MTCDLPFHPVEQILLCHQENLKKPVGARHPILRGGGAPV